MELAPNPPVDGPAVSVDRPAPVTPRAVESEASAHVRTIYQDSIAKLRSDLAHAKRIERWSWALALLVMILGLALIIKQEADAASSADSEDRATASPDTGSDESSPQFPFAIFGFGIFGCVWAATRTSLRRSAQIALDDLEFTAKIDMLVAAAEGSPGASQDTARIKGLVARRNVTALRAAHRRTLTFFQVAVIGTVLLATIPILDKALKKQWLADKSDYYYIVIYALAGAAWAWTRRTRLSYLEEEMRDAELEADLSRFPLEPLEWRAVQFLRNNEFQLKQYYGLNLRQNGWLLIVGIVCIVAGIAVVGLTLWQMKGLKDDSEKIVAGVLGAIGSILANYVAKVVLEMNDKAGGNLRSFYAGLSRSHELFLANVINSGIENDQLRRETAAKIALAMVTTKDAAPAG